MGGEKSMFYILCGASLGSPPHGRGKVWNSKTKLIGEGITPAWAGKRCRCLPATSSFRDHPRMGGEKRSSALLFVIPRGSPPHGRGKVMKAVLITVIARITPAWAGKRPNQSCCYLLKKDHPRMGGEKHHEPSPPKPKPGSPPHGRGKGRTTPARPRKLGITPAWAGKSFSHRWAGLWPGDHPRMGGEKTSTDRPRIADIGSPPHGRGKVESGHVGMVQRRITPAWAGKRTQYFPACSCIWDHPRMGGEKMSA